MVNNTEQLPDHLNDNTKLHSIIKHLMKFKIHLLGRLMAVSLNVKKSFVSL